ncbi:ATPase, T2SS/T4P/T4SS family [Pseudoalteromonas prydzensis]|uniref:ATPase, T2SS/T4P/T4SS family n=1 Tax=Pseudoalteromonas prydzensis TaxID=182141 RepID=UPI003FD278DA
MKLDLDLSYQGLNKHGLSVFDKTAQQCIAYVGNGDTRNSKTKFVIVLTSKQVREEAFILATSFTALNDPFIIQNFENELNVKHHFVKISRHIVDKQTVESFIQDAKELKLNKVSSNIVEEEETTAISKFKSIVADAIERGSNDIHWWVEPSSSRIVLRIDSEMAYEKGYNKLESRGMISAVLQQYAPGFRGYESDSRPINLPIDITVDLKDPNTGRLTKEGVRLRMNRTGSKDREGYKATFRIQRRHRKHSNLDSLNYEPWMEQKLSAMLDEPFGIFIATGKINSGKSTTIKAMLEMLPHTKSGISIEDPIEFDYDHPNIHPVQVDIDDPNSTLEALLHASLRQDPDFINVSEIRTPTVASDVLGHARVGCVMTSTLHTNDAITSFDRLCELGVTPKELANTELFLGFLSQRLMKVICSDCCKTAEKHGTTVSIRNKAGCKNCNEGYLRGLIAVAELLVPDENDATFIEDKDWVKWRRYLLAKGFKTMAIRALELSNQKKICYLDASKSVPSFKQLESHLRFYEPTK